MLRAVSRTDNANCRTIKRPQTFWRGKAHVAKKVNQLYVLDEQVQHAMAILYANTNTTSKIGSNEGKLLYSCMLLNKKY